MFITAIKYATEDQSALRVTQTVGGKDRTIFVSWPCNTWHLKPILAWLAKPNTIEAFEVSSKRKKRLKIHDIKDEMLVRFKTKLQQVGSYEEMRLFIKFANGIQLSAKGTAAREIYLYGRDQVQAMGSADNATIDAYDPVTDSGWPT